MKVFVSHDHEDTKACAPLLRTLDAWGVDYYFDYAEDLFGQQISDRVQTALAQSQVFVRVCTRATARSYWMSIESGSFMGLLADDHRLGRSGRRIVSLILDPAYAREPFDTSTTVIDATDTEHPQWVNTFRAALGLPPLHDLAEVARGIYSPPPAPRVSRRTAIGLGAAGVVALAAAGAGGLVLYERGKSTTTTSAPLQPPTTDPALKWSFFAGDPKNLSGASISATPVLDNGTLYVGTQQGTLYALRAKDGTKQWTWTAGPGTRIIHTPVVAGGTIYLIVPSNGIYALDESTSAKRWQIPDTLATEVHDVSYLVAANGYIYETAFALFGFIGALAPDSGDLKYQLYPRESDVIPTSAPCFAADSVYIGANDGYVYALDAATPGPELWRAEAGAAKALQLKQATPFYITATPSVAGGIVYVGSQDNSVYALDARSGAKMWSFPTNDQITYSSPVIANGVLYIGSTDKNLYALDAHTGQLVWQYATGGEINGRPTLTDGVVYVGSYDKYVHAVDARSGKLIRKYQAGGKVFAQPVVADGVLYAVTGNGWVLAFRLG